MDKLNSNQLNPVEANTIKGFEYSSAIISRKTVHLYKEVIDNYQSCHRNTGSLSDTWSHTLARKGEIYTIEEMIRMRFPGNRVNSWMVDSLFLVDKTILDLNNPVIVRLLELGESDFGNPRKDIKVMGCFFSSLFLVDVVHAARLIQLIEDLELTYPRVMDIGGGSGLLLSLLRRYFNNRITLFFVDIPETLLIQEWYLRNCFPEVNQTYKSSKKGINFIENGFNFINAYVLESQNIEFDIVCNLSSMDEMPEETIQTYLTYIEKNISSNGVFYFSNRFGQSSRCVEEPSEYNLDANWKVESIRIGYPIEMCGNGFLLGVNFRRTREQKNAFTRRLVLRTIWNGYFSGLIQNEEILQNLIGLTYIDQDPIEGITQILKRCGIQTGLINSLKDSLYFPYEFYINNIVHYNHQTTGEKYTNHYLEEVVRSTETEIIRLMLKIPTNPKKISTEFARKQVDNVCEQFSRFENEPLQSEYWTARFAGILFALEHSTKASSLIRMCVESTDQTRWLLRFAILFSRFGFLKETDCILKKLDKNVSDPFSSLKQIELEHSCGYSQDLLLDATTQYNCFSQL